MTNTPTIKDVAQKANVSVATVSRVLNDLPGFSAETEKIVEDAIQTLGYQRNAVARNLKMKKSNTIAALLPQVETTFYVKILSGIEDMAQDYGYSVIICHVGVSGVRTKDYMKILMERQVDGIIGCSLPPKEEIDTLMANSNIPSVLVSTLSYQYPIPYIKVDDFQAIYAATAYLVSKGHKKIAMLAGSNDDIIAGIPRLSGYKQALKDNQLSVNEKLIKYTRFSYDTGLSAMAELLNEKEEFTAIIACCDEVAVAALSVAYEKGLSVPQDFSIIGYDNTIIAEMAIPPLTSVSQPLYEMGRKAFAMLLENIEEGIVASSQVVPFEIVERKTVRRL